MGSCFCRDKSNVDDAPGPRVSLPDSNMAEDSPAVIRNAPRRHVVEQYIIEMVQLVGSVSETLDHDQPSALVMLLEIADNSEGWKLVVETLIDVVPLNKPLGPSAITIIFDDSPLPAVNTVMATLDSLGLGRRRALSCNESVDNMRRERNLLVVLGCIAEKFAGPISSKLMSHEVQEYLYTFLFERRNPECVLQALLAIEKFSKTKECKDALLEYFEMHRGEHPVIPLEQHYDSNDLNWRLIGFCARWILDNMFLVPGRMLSYRRVDMSKINVMLDFKNTTDFLKVSSNGLAARCDVCSFESVRSTFEIIQGCWYYETLILTGGVMQIGWATKATNFSAQEGYGIGDDNVSLAYDGCRRLLWHKATPRYCEDATPWRPGDVLGCLIDLDEQEAIFSLNGVPLPVCKDIFMTINVGFFAAASFMCFQAAEFNFGTQAYLYPPTDREFKSFNDYGTLTGSEKRIIPRWLHIARFQQEEEEEVPNEDDGVCAICYDRTPDTILSPCRHKGFCYECAIRIPECAMCRERVWYYNILPL